jgi:hypothetical protein
MQELLHLALQHLWFVVTKVVNNSTLSSSPFFPTP